MDAQMYELSYWIKGSPVKEEYDSMLFKSGFTIVRYMQHQFKPVGYTGLWLLAESHLAIHSWPEYDKYHVNIASCNLDYFLKFDSMMKEKKK